MKPGDLVLVKADTFKGKRKIKDMWEDEACEVVHQITTDIPSYEVMDQHGQSGILHCNQLLLVQSATGGPLRVGVCRVQEQCASPNPVKPTPKGSGSEIMPQVDSGLVSTQCQTSKTSLGWINGKLQLLLSMSTGASSEEE